MYTSLFSRLGIRVNSVLPGFTRTPMTETVPDKVIEKLLKLIPLHRVAEPEGEWIFLSIFFLFIVQQWQLKFRYYEFAIIFSGHGNYITFSVDTLNVFNGLLFSFIRNCRGCGLPSLRQEQLHDWYLCWSYRGTRHVNVIFLSERVEMTVYDGKIVF